MSKCLPRLLLVVLLRTIVFAESPDFEQIKADFEHMAEKMPYLALDSVLFDRTDHHFRAADPRKMNEHFEVLKQVTDQKYPVEALLRLLKHDNPKVRTLAAVALFDREESSVLPALVDLGDDKSPTFDGHPELNAMWLKFTGGGPPALKQTVSYIIQAMVGFYMRPAGFLYDINDPSRGFAEYWAVRKNRSYCAGWFAVQLERAIRGTSARYPDSAERVQKVRQRIDQLPANDRAWVLLWLNGEMGSDVLMTEAELLDACKRLGADNLMRMLQNKIPTDDPDLQSRSSGNWFYERMSLFVLRHSGQLFRSKDSDQLLGCEKLRGACRTPWWVIAAAELNQEHATQILREAMSRFEGKYDSEERAELCAGIWQLVGDREASYVLDWFYNEKLELSSWGSRDRFISAVGSHEGGRQMIYLLIQDSRFAEIGWVALVGMIRVVNKWSDKPVVTEDEMRKAWHPFGIGHFDARQAEASEKYPKETAELLGCLGQWRESLRECLPKLKKAKK